MCVRTGSPAKKILRILLPQTTVFRHQKVDGDSCEFPPCNPCYLLCRRHAPYCIISVTALAAWCLLVWDRRSVERLPPYLAGLLSGMRRQSVPDVARSMLPYNLDTMLPRVALLRTARALRFACSSMLLTAAQRRLMVTPTCCFERRKCSFPLLLLLLFLWLHNQSCSAPRDMSIGTLTSVYFGRQSGVNHPPPKM